MNSVESNQYPQPILADRFKQRITAAALIAITCLVEPLAAGCSKPASDQDGITTGQVIDSPQNTENIPLQPVLNPVPGDIWAGYVALSPHGQKYTSVKGTFTVQPIVCDPKEQTSGYEGYSQWVGLDGWGNGTVEQVGIEADCEDSNPQLKGEAPSPKPHNFVPKYSAWYMNYGGGSYSKVLTFPIKPGERLDTSVTYAGNDTFSMRIDNETTNATYEKPATCKVESGANAGKSCDRVTAEWIIERSGNSALGSFGTATFENASATIDEKHSNQLSVSNLNGLPIDMTEDGQILATPSGLSQNGEAFRVFHKLIGHAGL